jgi:hypothetical protein
MWNGLLKILKFQVIRENKIIYEEENIKNILHTSGEAFCLSALFTGGTIPAFYYLGLDNRTILAVTDTMANLTQEPTTNGYARKAILGFTIVPVSGINRAIGNPVTFNAFGGSWGPVRSMFLTNNTGILISSASLISPVTLGDGDAVNMRMSMQLRDCP